MNETRHSEDTHGVPDEIVSQMCIRDRNTSLSNVPVESGCNVVCVRDSQRIN